MEVVDRKSINDDLTKYDYLAKKDDFIIVTEIAPKLQALIHAFPRQFWQLSVTT